MRNPGVPKEKGEGVQTQVKLDVLKRQTIKEQAVSRTMNSARAVRAKSRSASKQQRASVITTDSEFEPLIDCSRFSATCKLGYGSSGCFFFNNKKKKNPEKVSSINDVKSVWRQSSVNQYYAA